MTSESNRKQLFLNQETPNITYFTSEIIIAVLAICGNILVIMSFIRVPVIRQPRNFFILSLASADLLVGLIGIPVCLALSIGHPTDYLNACLMCLASVRFVHCASMLSYLLLTFDRWWAIAFPYSYQRKMTTGLASRAIVLGWVLSAILSSIQFAGWYNREGWEKSKRHCFFIPVVDFKYQLVSNVIIVSIVTAALVGAYGNIFQVMKKHQTLLENYQNRSQNDDSEETNKVELTCIIFAAKFRRDVTLATRLGKICLVFIVCQMPFVIVLTIWAFCNFEDCPLPTPLIVGCVVLFHASAAINPALYAFQLTEFRIAMKNTICHDRSLRANPL